MSDYCVVVTGGARARFFTLEPVEFPELDSGPRLVHWKDIFNPQKESAGKDLYTDPKTGRGRAARGGPAHGYDDHRSHYKDELDRRFSRQILDEAFSLVKTNHARYVILVAPAPMMGIFRQELHILDKYGIIVKKVAKDMTKFSPLHIHESLAMKNMLPGRRKPGA